MFEQYYPSIKKLIDEYEVDSSIFKSNKEIFSYYPQLFVMSMVSLFEKEIKDLCLNILNAPTIQLSSLTSLNRLVRSHPNDYLSKIYAKFRARDNNGLMILDATPFYNLFGGQSFRNLVEQNFNIEKTTQQNEYSQLVASLFNLAIKQSRYETDYINNDDIHERLKIITFSASEEAFLKLKYKRNKVAHNFLTGISDSFVNIRDEYYDAVLYVVSLKKVLSSMSSI